MPTANDLRPLIELQAQYNRVGTETPFGSQNYRRNADGTTTMVTDIGPEGRALVGRAIGLGMTDSARMQVPDQLNSLAGALAGRIGQRFGMDLGTQMQIGQQAPMPQQIKQGQPQSPPPAQLPPMPQRRRPGLMIGEDDGLYVNPRERFRR